MTCNPPSPPSGESFGVRVRVRGRRAFLRDLVWLGGGVAGLGLLGGCAPAPAPTSSSGRVYRVALFSQADESGEPVEGSRGDLIERLDELGYREGDNLSVVRRGANPLDGGEDENRAIAAELIGLPVDVIVAGGAGLRAARAATSVLPIVWSGREQARSRQASWRAWLDPVGT